MPLYSIFGTKTELVESETHFEIEAPDEFTALKLAAEQDADGDLTWTYQPGPAETADEGCEAVFTATEIKGAA
jgi:hypothetical protein